MYLCFQIEAKYTNLTNKPLIHKGILCTKHFLMTYCVIQKNHPLSHPADIQLSQACVFFVPHENN